ncbi:MAG: antitoxin [Desulfuromonas sp.]|jgi:NTP pyrophosphatase (non-canonical NTP hydrolase)|nr:MAG: antitoxin [Desulfuromonas sp.]
MKYASVYRATLEKWGEDAQCDQAVEECAELIAALKHYRRKKIDKQAVIDELADVTLMIGQLTWMFGANEVEQAVQDKLKKLDILLKSEAGL